jgi:hypothetical protein
VIISHKYKFIFIKTCKTAGSSIEFALSKFCGSEDIITGAIPEEVELRKSLGYRGPQNYVIPKANFGFHDWRRYLYKGTRPIFLKHGSASHIKKYISKEIWNSYYKFCVERNPWDRMISQYYWRNKSEQKPTISKFLESDEPSTLQKSGINLYTIDGEIVVDKICFYENLEEDLEKVRIQCRLPEKIILPKTKSGARKDKRTYREILNSEQAEKIGELSSKEIELFGYKF